MVVMMMMVAVVVRLTKGSARYENNDGYERQVKIPNQNTLKRGRKCCNFNVFKGIFSTEYLKNQLDMYKTKSKSFNSMYLNADKICLHHRFQACKRIVKRFSSQASTS